MSTTAPAEATIAPRGLLILVGLGAATLVIIGMRLSASILAPVILTMVLMITVHPIRGWLVRRGLPGWLAGALTVLTVYLILALMIVALVVSVAKLAEIVPAYAAQLNDMVQQGADELEGLGVGAAQVDAVVSSLDVGQLFTLATSLLSSSLGVLTNLFFIATLALFIGVDGSRFPSLLQGTRTVRPAVVDALSNFTRGTRRYYAVATGFGAAVAVIDTIALSVLGIPAAMVWGVLAFVTNYIPNVGFIIGLVPPAVLALLEGGPSLMLAVIAVYSVINVVIQSVIQPKVVGDALGLGTTITFLSLVFWAWILGPLGAILALPMTLLAKALFVDVDPTNRWLVPLLSVQLDDPVAQGSDAAV